MRGWLRTWRGRWSCVAHVPLHPISDASLLGAMGNRPPIMRHTFELLLELADEEVLPKRYLELALVTEVEARR